MTDKINNILSNGTRTFGKHLLYKGLINHCQLADALSCQDYVNKSLPELAVKLEFLTEEEANQINKICRDFNISFSEIVIQNKYLSLDQLDEVIVEQMNTRLYLGEVLVNMNIINRETLEEELVDYILKNQGTDLQRIAENGTNNEPDVIELLVDVSEQCLKQFGGFIVTDIQVHKDLSNYRSLNESEIVSSVSMIGDIAVEISLTVSSNFVEQLAADIMEKYSKKFKQDIVLDVTTELLTTICGNLASTLSFMDIVTDISTPYISDIKEFMSYLDVKENKQVLIELKGTLGKVMIGVIL